MVMQSEKRKYPNNLQACMGHQKKATIAREVGIPERTLWRILDQDAPIPPDKVELLAKRLGVSPSELLRKKERWNIPYQRNLFFTGRDEELAHLHMTLHGSKTVAITQSHALCGLGGIGKTQTVLEYAYRYRHEYQAVLWVKADTEKSVQADMLALATLLDLQERDAQDQEVKRAAVARWLREQSDWLLIFDNADELEIVEKVLPTGYRGHILLTTRAQSTGRLARRFPVEEMSPEVGALFLLRRLGRISPDESLDKVSLTERDQAMELARELGGLPLALDQAGAFIEETPCSLTDYLELYRQRRVALLSLRGGIVNDHPEPVTTTWSISFSEIERLHPRSADLLRVCAFLDPDAIPEELITDGVIELGSQLASVESDSLALMQTIGALWRYSLIRRNPDTKILNLHRLVQVVLRDAMSEEEQREWAERVVRAVHRAFPSKIDMQAWTHCQRLLPQAQMCVSLIDQYGFCFLEAAHLLNQTAYYLRERARYSEAEGLYQRALTIRVEALGEDHIDTAQSCYNLARLYFDTSRYPEAEALYQRALDIRERQLGREHVMIAQTLNSIALTLWCWGVRYDQAEQLYEQALRIFDATVGREHVLTAHCMNNLALLYLTLGRYEEAEYLHRDVLTIRERILPAIHLDTAQSLQNLACVYVEQANKQKHVEAEYLLQRSLAIREQLLGMEHPQTARSLNNLALLYEACGRDEEAAVLYSRALDIREKILGADNKKTTATRDAYTALLRKMGKEEVTILFEKRQKAQA